jgi:hypothetical protein
MKLVAANFLDFDYGQPLFPLRLAVNRLSKSCVCVSLCQARLLGRGAGSPGRLVSAGSGIRETNCGAVSRASQSAWDDWSLQPPRLPPRAPARPAPRPALFSPFVALACGWHALSLRVPCIKCKYATSPRGSGCATDVGRTGSAIQHHTEQMYRNHQTFFDFWIINLDMGLDGLYNQFR